MEHVREQWRRLAAGRQDTAYRGVPLKLDAGQGVPILQALVKGQRNVAARLIIDAMAMRAMDKAHWWSIGDQPNDEAGRWWTSSKSAAYDYSLGQYSENWMTMPVVMTAEFSESDESAREDGQGAWWWHLPAGHPLTITRFEAALPDDPQALLDGWNGISSPGNFDHPIGVDGDFVDLPIPPMRTTARSEAGSVWRGMALDASTELYEEALRKKDYRHFAEDCIQRAIEQAGREWGGSQAPGQGIGLSWTLTRRVAEKFANRNGSISLGNYSFIPVLFEADYESDWVSREPESAGSQYGYSPTGQPEWKYEEFEVLLRPGAPLELKRVVIGVPANIRSFLSKLTQDGDAHTTEIAWVEVSMARRVTAMVKTADDLSLDANDMRFYEWEGKQQRANGGGRKINTASEAAQLGERVLRDYGFDPAKVTWSMGTWESWTKDDGGRCHINIGYGYSGDGAANAWTVLHEVAHAILFLRGNANHRHGADFEALMLELIQRYTRVRNITPRSS